MADDDEARDGGERLTIEPPHSSGAFQKVGVLLVDDEALVRRTMVRSIERIGLRTLQCGTAAEALRILADDSMIRLLVTDVSLRGGNGVELAEEARRTYPELDVVFVSGHARPELEALGLDPVADRVLLKPFSPAELVGVVRDTLADGATRPRRAPRSSDRR